jgi:hypothetical protein
MQSQTALNSHYLSLLRYDHIQNVAKVLTSHTHLSSPLITFSPFLRISRLHVGYNSLGFSCAHSRYAGDLSHLPRARAMLTKGVKKLSAGATA